MHYTHSYFSNEECEDLINSVTRFHESRVGKNNQVIKEIRVSKHFNFTPGPKLYSKIKEYLATLGLNVCKPTQECSIIKYKEGSHFAPHKDGKIYNSGVHKVGTVIVQLSDKDDYENGNLIVGSEPAPRDRGTIIYFDSKTIHEVTKLNKGIRYSLAYFVLSDQIKGNAPLI